MRRLIALPILLWALPSLASNDLFVSLTTDYRAREEFTAIETTVTPLGSGTPLHTSRRNITRADDLDTLFLDDFSPVPAGTYEVEVHLIDERATKTKA